MGSCLSKKGSSPSTSAVITAAAPPSDPTFKAKKEEEVEQKNASVQAQETVKKEIFLIKQRKSHERRPEEKGGNTNTAKEECNSNGSSCHVKDNNGGAVPVTTVRTSSCTKEEVDAILIQCGRLSRSSSGKVPGTSDNNNSRAGLGSSGSRKYSGSKRSYDFDQDNSKKGSTNDADNETEEDEEEEEEKQNQLYQRQSRPSRSHRRTPSREKDVHNKRSSSGDRVSSSGGGEERRRSGSSGGRKTSRSPGRRSENPTVPASNPPGPDKSRPGRLVSVPASISTKEKTNYIPDSASKRVSVKRGGEVGGGLRTSASPRSQSPANTRASNENTQQQQQQQVPSLSRNSSKKTERSPYRRNPMSEIDENILKNEQVSMRSAQDGSKATVNKLQKNRREGTTEEGLTKQPTQIQSLKPDERNSGVFTEHPQGKEEEQQHIVEVAVTTGATGVADSLKPQTITRSRSSRRSRDFDLNQGLNPDETLLNHTAYASMLLEDIQNFHQQKNMTGFSLPPCVTKACSILEAVADLNSCTSSNLSYAFSDDKISEADRSLKNVTSSNDPFLESEVGVINDLMEPSLHKYVTVRRGVVMGGEMEQQESSGSNNFSLNQHWGASPSLWDPNSADSTERWSSMSNNEDEVVEKEQQQRSSSPLGFLHQKQTFSEPTRKIQMGGRRSKQCGNEATTLLPTATQNGGKRLCGSL